MFLFIVTTGVTQTLLYITIHILNVLKHMDCSYSTCSKTHIGLEIYVQDHVNVTFY